MMALMPVPPPASSTISEDLMYFLMYSLGISVRTEGCFCADVFIEVRPVNTFALTDQAPIIALLRLAV
jgi:hypothetical protein